MEPKTHNRAFFESNIGIKMTRLLLERKTVIKPRSPMSRPLGDPIEVALNSLFEMRRHADVAVAGQILHDTDPSHRPVWLRGGFEPTVQIAEVEQPGSSSGT
jgi:hypothetical protein